MVVFRTSTDITWPGTRACPALVKASQTTKAHPSILRNIPPLQNVQPLKPLARPYTMITFTEHTRRFGVFATTQSTTSLMNETFLYHHSCALLLSFHPALTQLQPHLPSLSPLHLPALLLSTIHYNSPPTFSFYSPSAIDCNFQPAFLPTS